ncbi:MAG: hypothetical protein JWP66_1432 [Naasia sp.]|nr:hypothetical protein [Naasia sp.]
MAPRGEPRRVYRHGRMLSRGPAFAPILAWRIRLVAYGARLESVLGESPRGFESPILRQRRKPPPGRLSSFAADRRTMTPIRGGPPRPAWRGDRIPPPPHRNEGRPPSGAVIVVVRTILGRSQRRLPPQQREPPDDVVDPVPRADDADGGVDELLRAAGGDGLQMFLIDAGLVGGERHVGEDDVVALGCRAPDLAERPGSGDEDGASGPRRPGMRTAVDGGGAEEWTVGVVAAATQIAALAARPAGSAPSTTTPFSRADRVEALVSISSSANPIPFMCGLSAGRRTRNAGHSRDRTCAIPYFVRPLDENGAHGRTGYGDPAGTAVRCTEDQSRGRRSRRDLAEHGAARTRALRSRGAIQGASLEIELTAVGRGCRP